MRKLIILIMAAIIGITCLSACENKGNEKHMVESNSETIATETTTVKISLIESKIEKKFEGKRIQICTCYYF